MAVPRPTVVCASWPQACIIPGLLEAQGMSAFSKMGRASMSVRMARTFPLGALWPVSSATTPVLPTIS